MIHHIDANVWCLGCNQGVEGIAQVENCYLDTSTDRSWDVSVGIDRLTHCHHRSLLGLLGETDRFKYVPQPNRSMNFSKRIDRPHPQVQELGAEPANDQVERRLVSFASHQDLSPVRSNVLLDRVFATGSQRFFRFPLSDLEKQQI